MITITNLLCHRDISMALTSLRSFTKHCKDPYSIKLFEDGTLTNEDKRILLQEFEHCEIIDKKTVDERVEPLLEDYPACQEFRGSSPFSIKLFDMPLFLESDYVYFDSDVFFIKDFQGFDDLRNKEDSLILMNDIFDMYSINYVKRFIYPRFKIPDNICAGFYYLKNGTMDLDLMEWFFSKKENFQDEKQWWRLVLAEQTAWALLAGKKKSSIWNKEQVLIPTSIEEITPKAIAVHLVKKYRHLLDNIQHYIDREQTQVAEMTTETMSYSNLVTAAVRRIKFRLNRV